MAKANTREGRAHLRGVENDERVEPWSPEPEAIATEVAAAVMAVGSLPEESPEAADPIEDAPDQTSATNPDVRYGVAASELAYADDAPWTQPVDRGGKFGRVGQAMVDRGLITTAQLDEALELQRTTGRRVGDSLVEIGAVSRFELTRVLADHLGVPFVDLRARPPDPMLASILPEDLARRYRALPITHWEDQVVVAMANPNDLFALDDLRMVIHLPIIAAMADEEDLAAAIERVYQGSTVEMTVDDAVDDYESLQDIGPVDAVTESDGPVIRLVNALMEQAVADHASDLHVEPNSKIVAIRFRIDGVLHDISEVPLAVLRPLVSRLKILGDLDIAQTRMAQDGRFSVKIQGRPVDVRVVTVPTAAGESVVLRLLDPVRDALDVSSLGLSPEEEARFIPAFHAPQGAVFITGPTGSGKTSTVYAVMSQINTRTKSIVSVEDPVEYRLDGVKQIQINPRAGVMFPNALRSILRADPDVVLIGEVRDAETARIAADASITGHLVLSTVHTNSAAATPMRLVDMGVEPYLVASALTMVAGQRLARRLCEKCAVLDEHPDYELLRRMGADDAMLENATIRVAVGCPACRASGYRGRVALLEIMPVTEGISRMIVERAASVDIERFAVEEGMLTLRAAALQRIARGMLSAEEMLRVIA